MPASAHSETVKKRSVTIAGHRTSFSLEEAFWLEVKKLAKNEGLSINQYIEKVDEARTSNLSSTLRLLVLKNLQDQIQSQLPSKPDLLKTTTAPSQEA